MATTTNNTPSETAPPTPDGFVTRPKPPDDVVDPLTGKVVVRWVWNATTGAYDAQNVNGGPVDDNGDSKGGKKPADPYAPIMRSFFSAYFKIWGTLPPPGYVEGAARSMNLYEFIDQERKKPAYRHTKAYKNEAAKYAALRDQLLGYY